jgi:hypothetical protein
MQTRFAIALLSSLALLTAGEAPAAGRPDGFVLEVLVDGRPLPEYHAHGTRYIEASKGRDYTIRLRNPLGVRVAVALSVDGLNTIDAQHTAPAEARKWVLDPYETVTIAGWQTSRSEARRFYFTTEDRSYATRLGQPDNQGVISAVFYRERRAEAVPLTSNEAGRTRDESQRAEAARRQAPAPAAGAGSVAQPTAPEEYAATGFGRRTGHEVRLVHLDLEDRPAAAVSLRYEYRPQLVRLGILPAPPDRDALARRERARGFEPGFCPEPR